MSFKKYLWKCRLLLINTPNYSHPEYKRSKDLYQKEIKGFHKRYIKLVTKLDKSKKFKVTLIGFDGTKKIELDKIYTKKIFEIVDKMPMNKLIKDKKFKPLNLSLFSDYKPETTLKGLGFKDKEKALFTVSAIKKRPIKYQVNVIATMLGRAKNHPNKTKDMNDAIIVFKKWMENYKANKKMKNKGFTLIELLVVVAIIGILAAVGVVAYSGYTSGAKKAKCMSDHKTLVKFISNGCMKCQIGQEFKLKMNTGGSNVIEKDRCNLVNIGDGDKLKSWIQHHFKQETLTSGNWCKIDGKPDSQGNCQEAVADGGYMGNGATIYEHEVHGCNNPNISDCNTLVVETNCTDSTFIRNTIQLK